MGKRDSEIPESSTEQQLPEEVAVEGKSLFEEKHLPEEVEVEGKSSQSLTTLSSSTLSANATNDEMEASMLDNLVSLFVF